MKQCKIKIEVLADLLLSGGEGSALGLDRAVTRDVDGNLELRASHLMGVWREAAREWAVLADAVQFDDSTRWRALADQLFGTDRHRRLMGVGQVQLATTAAQAVAWQTTAREAWSRRPKDDTLRAVEAVPAGTTFDATLWSQADDNVHVEALVAGSLQRLTALGGSRNRGWGRVRIEVGHWATVESNSPPKLIAESGQSDLHRLRLALRVDTPVLLTDTSVPGDLLPTAVVVPGAALRGAVLTALRKVAGADVAEQAATHALFGDALPVPAQAIAQLDHLETLPVPLTLQAVKRVVNKAQAPSGGRAAPWWAEATTGAPHVTSDSHADRLATAASNDGDVLKRVKDKVTLWRVNDGPWSLHGPRLQTNLRNGVQPLDHATGVRDDTDLFSEERIAQGECFVADLWVPAAWSNDLAKWLSGTQLPVGRGGGRLQVSAASAAPNQAAGTGENQAEAVTLTLASDFAVRADDLGWCGDLGIATWRALFGAAWPADVQVADGGRGPQELSETVVLRGYNRTTGLPRWPVIAVKAGSAVRLLGPATAVARVRKLLTARPAHGERTQDGLGRVVLDLDIHAGLPKTTEARPATRTAGNRDRLDLLAQRLLAEPCKLQLSRSQRYDAFAGMRGNSTKAAREWIAAQVAWAKARGIDAAVAESMVRTTFADGALQASEGK